MKEKQGEARNIDKKNSETQKKEKEERRNTQGAGRVRGKVSAAGTIRPSSRYICRAGGPIGG